MCRAVLNAAWLSHPQKDDQSIAAWERAKFEF